MSDGERIVTAIPGPRSRALAERLRAVESRGVTYVADDFPTFWASASGATVTDVDGNRYLDLTSAFGVALTGTPIRPSRARWRRRRRRCRTGWATCTRPK